MAKGRMLKKEISESKKLGYLESDSARLLYTWLIPWLDIEGRYTADPDILKGHLFPKIKSMTIEKIEELLFELAEKKLIYLYKSNGEQYLQFTKFKELQSLHPERESKSEIPSPDENSCELMTTHDLSPQVKLKKVKVKEAKVREEVFFEEEFESLWKNYHPDGRKNKPRSRIRFIALCKRGELEEFKKGFYGYATFLEFKHKRENFKQGIKYFSTLITDYKEYIQYYRHKVDADL